MSSSATPQDPLTSKLKCTVSQPSGSSICGRDIVPGKPVLLTAALRAPELPTDWRARRQQCAEAGSPR
jgi:hypothetical protein